MYHTARVDLEWQDPEARIAYAHGGAGYILSWALLKELRPLIADCHERYVNWAGARLASATYPPPHTHW